jgi:hypothetical protein
MESNSSQESENVHLIDGKDLESLVIVTRKGDEEVANNSEGTPADETTVGPTEDHSPNDTTGQDPDRKDNSNSNQEVDNLSDEDKKTEEKDMKAELSQALEGLATKDDLANATKENESKRQELEKQLNEMKAIKVAELAEKVFTKEVEIGIVKEDAKDDRVKKLVEMGEPTMNVLMSSYNAIPAPPENDKGEAGEPNPRAANLSNQDDKLTPEKEDEVCQELRNRYFGHKDARVTVRPMGPDPDSNTIRYIAVEKIGE